MPKIAYEKINLSAGSLSIISKANEILRDYARQGYDLTLRQLYYQFVSRDLIRNKDTEYKRLGSIINDARLAGLIDWGHIVDRTRNLRALSHWTDPESIVSTCAEQFRLDKWANQENYVEVWIEKDALVGVLEKACQPLDVPYFSCRGYTSQSEMWSASQRLLKQIRNGKRVTILHLGDHDPSGVDMTRDINDRLNQFVLYHRVRDIAEKHEQGSEESREDYVTRLQDMHNVDMDNVHVNRIALTMDQIRQYDPPPNPAKLTDVRATKYIEEYGDSSWELDALEPAVITTLIQENVTALLDEGQWADDVDQEDNHKADIKLIADNWEKVVKRVRKS